LWSGRSTVRNRKKNRNIRRPVKESRVNQGEEKEGARKEIGNKGKGGRIPLEKQVEVVRKGKKKENDPLQ